MGSVIHRATTSLPRTTILFITPLIVLTLVAPEGEPTEFGDVKEAHHRFHGACDHGLAMTGILPDGGDEVREGRLSGSPTVIDEFGQGLFEQSTVPVSSSTSLGSKTSTFRIAPKRDPSA